MLEFFRKHQRIFFIFVAILIILSFSFFGTYSALTSFTPQKEIVIGRAIDGSKLIYSDITHLGELLGQEKGDSGLFADLFLKTGIADRLEAAYFDKLKGEWQTRLDRAKRARFYVHPHAPFLNVRDLWTRLAADMVSEIDQLRKRDEVTPDFFASWSRLYSLQEKAPGELIKRILFYQQNQLKIPPDPHLGLEDFSLFGYRTVEEWFGRDFLQLAAQFIFNASIAAEKEGFKVGKREAETDFRKRFDASRATPEAIRLWQKALSFAHYFQSVGQAVLEGPLSYRKIAEFECETAIIDLYQLPKELRLKSPEDCLLFETYLELACQKPKDLLALPTAYLSVEEIEKRAPELLFTKIALRYAEIDTSKIAARLTIRDVWNWQTSVEGWSKMRAAFSTLSDAKEADERFQQLEKLESGKRTLIDEWARGQIVAEHPEWQEREFEKEELKDVEWILLNDSIAGLDIKRPLLLCNLLNLALQGEEEAKLSLHQYREEGESRIYRIEDPKIILARSILSFGDAKEMGRMQKSEEQAASSIPTRLQHAMQEALSSLQKEGVLPTLGLWEIEKSERKISRNSEEEEWMREQSFVLNMGNWSQLHVPANGDIVFIFVKEHKVPETSILERIQLGKTALAREAESELAAALLEIVQKKQAMTTPVRIKEAPHDDL